MREFLRGIGINTTRYFADSAMVSKRVSKLVTLEVTLVTRNGCPGMASTSMVFGSTFSPACHTSIVGVIFAASGMATFKASTTGSRPPFMVTRIVADCAPLRSPMLYRANTSPRSPGA